MINERDAQPELTGRAVVLRPWSPGDVDAVYAACQDADIQRWTTVPTPYLREHAAEYVTVTAPRTWTEAGALFAVIEPGSGELAASMGAHRVQNGVAEIGYWTRREFRRRGLTGDALRTLTDWLFAEVEVARAELIIEPENAGSIGVARAAGFEREGLLRQRFVLKGRRTDGLILSRLPSDPVPVTPSGVT